MRLFEFANPRAPLAAQPQIACAGGGQYRMTSGAEYLDHFGGKSESAIMTLIASLLRPGDRVLDVGAKATLTAGHREFDFLRIDVENFERGLLEALQPAIARCRPVVVLDVNHWNLDECQRTSVPDFLACLRGVFPLLYAVDGAHLHDLHDADGACQVMYSHIVNHSRYPRLVGAFEQSRLPPAG